MEHTHPSFPSILSREARLLGFGLFGRFARRAEVPQEPQEKKKPADTQHPHEPEKEEKPQTREEIRQMKEEVAARPDMPLPEYLRKFKGLYQERQNNLCNYFNHRSGFSDPTLKSYQNLDAALQQIEDTAQKLEKSGATVMLDKDFNSLMRNAEGLLADLDKDLPKGVPSFEQERRAAWMQSMLAYGLPTELLHEGKHQQIQTLSVPDNVDVMTVAGNKADFVDIAEKDEYEGKNPKDATAFNQYARKLPQFRKRVTLMIPENETPVLDFSWGGKTVRVTGERQNNTWIFLVAQGEPVMPEQPERSES